MPTPLGTLRIAMIVPDGTANPPPNGNPPPGNFGIKTVRVDGSGNHGDPMHRPNGELGRFALGACIVSAVRANNTTNPSNYFELQAPYTIAYE